MPAQKPPFTDLHSPVRPEPLEILLFHLTARSSLPVQPTRSCIAHRLDSRYIRSRDSWQRFLRTALAFAPMAGESPALLMPRFGRRAPESSCRGLAVDT